MAPALRATHRQASTVAPVATISQPAFSVITAATLLFASGMAALIYEVLWTRQLTLVVGVDVLAVTTAVSGFFAGLAGGSWLFGRTADRMSPIRLYVALELAVGLLGIGATLALSHSEFLFAEIESRIGILAWLLPFLLVALPAFFMGGTLPTLVRACLPQKENVPSLGGTLYAANTAGGIAGALLTSFVLIPQLGIRNSAMLAAAVNLGVALAAIFLVRSLPQIPAAQPRNPGRPRRQEKNWPALVLYAVAGGVALGYEVVWSQAIIPFLSTRTFAFSIVLATYLTGLVVGSAAYTWAAKRVADPWSVFGILIASAGLIALLQVGALGKWLLLVQTQLEYAVLVVTHSAFGGICARFVVAAFAVVFIPTLLLGAAFPAVLRLAAGAEHSGRDVGTLLALNTAGGIVGTMLTGFLLVPALGLIRTLAILAICAAVIGLLACMLSTNLNRALRVAIIGVSLASVAAAALIPKDHMAQALAIARGGGEIVAYEESSGGTVAVVQERGGGGIFRRLYIQGVSNSGDALPSLRYMRLQALLPLLIHRGEPTSALVVGFGTGITAGALLCYEALQKRVAAELLPAVVRAAPLFHGNFNAAASSALQIRVRDGRRELVQNPEMYDLITLEPPPPSAAGVANLYSTDFYRLAAKRLHPDGLLAQWLPIAAQNDEDTRSLVRSFLDVFPYATAWTTEMHEVLLVGSQTPIELDANRIAARFDDPRVAAALQEVGIASPEELLALWLTDRRGLDQYAKNALPVTDNHPRIEYATWVRPDEILRVLPEWLSLRTDPPIVRSNEAFKAVVADHRGRLLDFYAAGLAAYQQDRQSWAQHIQRVFSVRDRNPYFLWSVGQNPTTER